MAKPFDCKINNDEKQEVLDWRNTVIMQVDCLTHLLEAWQANRDILPLFNKCKRGIYICQYFLKTEDQCSETIKQASS